MNMDSAFQSTCKVLLGEEIGDLETYSKYLLKHIEPVSRAKSEISGKEVAISSAEPFCKEARFISNEEAVQYEEWLKKSSPLSINQIKDLDSLLSALKERACYSGNVVLGNSSSISESTDCIDSHFAYSSWMLKNVKYAAFCAKVRFSEFVFGCTDGAQSNFCIKCYGLYMNTRCMEALRCKPIADCYYVANLQGCKNCMFSFNLRNKQYAIGNLELAKDEYLKLKQKLLEDIRETLKQKKTLPSIVAIISQGEGNEAAEPSKTAPSASRKAARIHAYNSALVSAAPPQIESAFQKTCEVIFGKRFPPLNECAGWLDKYNLHILPAPSCASTQALSVPSLPYYLPIKDRLASHDEALELGKRHLDLDQIRRLQISNSPKLLAGISFTTPETIFGSNYGMADTVDYQDSGNAYKSSFVFVSKGIGFTFFTRDCENVFGSYTLFFSNHCIRCRNSTNLARCFETSNSTNCADSFFLYNCENVRDSMFCFNAKNLRHAVGNIEVGQEEYRRIKKLVLDGILEEFGKKKRLDMSIYSIGCK